MLNHFCKRVYSRIEPYFLYVIINKKEECYMIDNYVLYKNLNELDLHGCNRYEAIIKVEEFINDNIKLGNHLVKIVHGKGSNILKENIHNYLKRNKKVIAYKIDIFNTGVTVVEI